jgi:hypothetical protein
MKGDRHKIEESGTVFHAVDLGGQRMLFHRHVFRALVEAGGFLFVLDKLTCSLR